MLKSEIEWSSFSCREIDRVIKGEVGRVYLKEFFRFGFIHNIEKKAVDLSHEKETTAIHLSNAKDSLQKWTKLNLSPRPSQHVINT